MNLTETELIEKKEEKKYQHKLLKLAKKISKISRFHGSYFYEPWIKDKQHQFKITDAETDETLYFIPCVGTDSAKYCYAFVTEELKKRGIYL